MISIKQLVFNPFQENTYILFDDNNHCIVIDPGCSSPQEEDQLESFLTDNKLIPVRLINTHCHVDHLFGNSFIVKNYNLITSIHKADLPLYNSAVESGIIFGMEVSELPEINEFIDERSNLSIGDNALEILHVPGHSPGSIALYCRSDNFIIVGDVLFSGSIGRTDLPGGNYNTLINSIKEKILVLPEDTIVFPGHGPSTTVEDEKRYNPFLVKGFF